MELIIASYTPTQRLHAKSRAINAHVHMNLKKTRSPPHPPPPPPNRGALHAGAAGQVIRLARGPGIRHTRRKAVGRRGGGLPASTWRCGCRRRRRRRPPSPWRRLARRRWPRVGTCGAPGGADVSRRSPWPMGEEELSARGSRDFGRREERDEVFFFFLWWI